MQDAAFHPIVEVPGFLHAATSEATGSRIVYVYASPLVELRTDTIATPLRRYLAGYCYSVSEYREHEDPDMWFARGRSITLTMLEECPGCDLPHSCTVEGLERGWARPDVSATRRGRSGRGSVQPGDRGRGEAGAGGG